MNRFTSKFTLCPPKAAPGFTVLELLACVAILGLLTALLVPALGRVKDSGRQAACVSNLRQVHAALMMYVSENDGRLPDVGVRPVTSSGVGSIYTWHRAIATYLGAPDDSSAVPVHKILQCPEVALIGREMMTREDRMKLPNYGMNEKLGRLSNDAGAITKGKLTRMAEIAKPGSVLLIGDNGMATSSPQIDLTPAKVALQGDKHPSGSNMLWADGHVTTWKDVTRLAKDPFRSGGREDVWNP